jgi:tetratricopeptide (TPR) repeat protein
MRKQHWNTISLTHIGGSHRRSGDLQRALTYYQEALDISQTVSSHEDIIFGLINVGWAAYRLDGDPEIALGHVRRALAMAEQAGFQFAIGRAYHALAEICFSEGDGDQAWSYFQKLVRLSEETGYKVLSDPAHRRMVEIRGTGESDA